MLPPYNFYHYFFSVPDVDVIRFLKTLNFLSLDEIKILEDQMSKSNLVDMDLAQGPCPPHHSPPLQPVSSAHQPEAHLKAYDFSGDLMTDTSSGPSGLGGIILLFKEDQASPQKVIGIHANTASSLQQSTYNSTPFRGRPPSSTSQLPTRLHKIKEIDTLTP